MIKKLPDFSKKLVSLSLIGREQGSVVDRPCWEMQGGRLFLVGTVPLEGSTYNWSKGVACAVAWDQVTDYLVFDSVEDYLKRLDIYERHKKKK
jgi:hypothetical protein